MSTRTDYFDYLDPLDSGDLRMPVWPCGCLATAELEQYVRRYAVDKAKPAHYLSGKREQNSHEPF